MLAVARSVTADAGQRDYRSYRLPRTRIDRTTLPVYVIRSTAVSRISRPEGHTLDQPHRIDGTIDMANQNREINRTERGNSKSSERVGQVHRVVRAPRRIADRL